jgi:predicted nuclease of predicted toxin-antitoxin system
MRLWIDAQLPPQIAPWIAQTFGVEAQPLAAIGMRDADDAVIFESLRQPGEIVMSKDSDFLDLVARLGAPPQVIWVTCGNVTNRALRALLTAGLPKVLELLAAGEAIVELAGAAS